MLKNNAEADQGSSTRAVQAPDKKRSPSKLDAFCPGSFMARPTLSQGLDYFGVIDRHLSQTVPTVGFSPVAAGPLAQRYGSAPQISWIRWQRLRTT